MAPAAPDAPLGLYIHVPFCSHICPYCDFNTYRGQEALIPRYVDALVRDLTEQLRAVDGRPVSSIYFGGGTPSMLSPEQVGRVINACMLQSHVQVGAEVTLEANPRGLDAGYFSGLRAAGVNRLSLGLQTTDRRGLRTLGRQHEAVDALAALSAAHAGGIDNVSIDLIYGWTGQTLIQWQRDIETVLGWPIRPDHLSLYSLIVEPGTPMADAVQRGILAVVDDDATADMYEAAQNILGEAGYVHYEVSNWARDIDHRSRHNLIYWRNGDYIGAGAGAHGQLGATRVMNHLLPRTYIEAIECGDSPVSNVEQLEPRTKMGETMMLGLRLIQEGVRHDEFLARHGVELAEVFGAVVVELQQLGMLELDPKSVRLTPRGLMVANDVVSRFL